MATEMIVIVVFMIISILISFGIGANDETFATVYGSRILSMKWILIIGVVLGIAGTLILGGGVSKTVGEGILSDSIVLTDAIVLTILTSTAIWLITSSIFGLPISTTHATIGAIIGIGLLLEGFAGINWMTILELGIWWILSPFIGFVVTYYIYKLIHKVLISKLNGFKKFEFTENIFAFILLLVTCWTAFSRAGNDCSNSVGILVGVGLDLNLILLITGISMAGGLVVIGRNVVKNVGTITELHPSTAFAAQVPIAVILFVGTIFGIPLSGSHMLVASLVGLAKSRNAPTKKGLWKIVLVWLLTFPVAAILAVVLYFPLSLIFA